MDNISSFTADVNKKEAFPKIKGSYAQNGNGPRGNTFDANISSFTLDVNGILLPKAACAIKSNERGGLLPGTEIRSLQLLAGDAFALKMADAK